jgi:hypothetical protein
MAIRIKPTGFVRDVPKGFYIVRTGEKASGFLSPWGDWCALDGRPGDWSASNMRANCHLVFPSALTAARYALTGAPSLLSVARPVAYAKRKEWR